LGYDLVFQGHRINLFDAANLQDQDLILNQVAAIDRYLEANHVPIVKLASSGPQGDNDQKCLLDDSAADNTNYAFKRHLFLSQTAG
jgi:hypothetical protein